jgi:hypothetical protein
VVANGGSVSASTMKAVSKFCADIDAAGIRDRFYRVSLMAGSNLNAALVPLYRGQSRTGTQYGNTTDTNDNFVSGDYAENSGLDGNGSNKRLGTGLLRSTMASALLHMGVFVHTRNTGAFTNYLRCQDTAAGPIVLALITWNPAGTIRCLNDSPPGQGGTSSTQTYADKDFLLGCCSGTASGDLRLLINGTQVSTGQGRDTSGLAAQFTLFARQNLDTQAWSEHANGIIGGYSIGTNLTNTEGATYSTIWDAFLKALGRR